LQDGSRRDDSVPITLQYTRVRRHLGGLGHRDQGSIVNAGQCGPLHDRTEDNIRAIDDRTGQHRNQRGEPRELVHGAPPTTSRPCASAVMKNS
jgi:hypothetical protein